MRATHILNSAPRSGAHFNLRKLAEAKADATKACELGVSEGCVRAKQLQ